MTHKAEGTLIKVMLDGRYKRGGNREWCVAVGDVPKPSRGCLWFVSAFFESVDAAMPYFNKLDPEHGRALLDLRNPRLRFISPDGRLLRCIEIEDKLLS